MTSLGCLEAEKKMPKLLQKFELITNLGFLPSSNKYNSRMETRKGRN